MLYIRYNQYNFEKVIFTSFKIKYHEDKSIKIKSKD